VTGFVKDAQGRVRGATTEADGSSFTINAGSVVNATGVWADDVRALDEGTHPDSIRPAKGIHITVPWSKVQNRIAVVIPVPKDKRSVFVVPWGGTGGDYEFTYIGTTDTDYDGSLDDPQCTSEDIEYLLRAINFSVNSPLSANDILGTWAGLRPLVKSATSGRTADLSRSHRVARSTSDLISITGGKLTTYREMAADTIDEVIDVLGRDATKHASHRSRTKRLHLRGADGYAAALASAGSDPVLRHLVERYGDEARSVLALADRQPSLKAPLVAGLPYLKAEAVYAARHEMARSVDDVLTRRTRARLLARDATASAAAEVAALLAPELGWDDREQARQVTRYLELIDRERAAADLPATVLEAAIGS
jgi:glycerol-3-phosphate dehydrogenase